MEARKSRQGADQQPLNVELIGQEQDLLQMQQDYEKYFLKKEKKKPTIYEADKYSSSKLFVLGTAKGRLLCRVKTVHLQSNGNIKKRQKEVNNNSQGQVICDPVAQRFWKKRYSLFSKFDEGIQLDEESWFSVTPEAVAIYIARKICRSESVVLDGFCGAGGDSIQLAGFCDKVIANDIDQAKIKMLEHNAKIYGVFDKITTSCCSFMDLQFDKGQVNLIYMSPPWGGPQYYQQSSIRPQDMQPPLDQILTKAFTISSSVALLLSANMNLQSLAQTFAQTLKSYQTLSCTLVVEKIFFGGRLKFLLVMFGRETARVDTGDQLSYIYRMLSQEGQQFRLREEFGMVGLLNSVFQCQNYLWQDKASLFQKLKAHVLHKQLLTVEEFQELIKKDEEIDYVTITRRSAKHRKMRRKNRNVRQAEDSRGSEQDCLERQAKQEEEVVAMSQDKYQT